MGNRIRVKLGVAVLLALFLLSSVLPTTANAAPAAATDSGLQSQLQSYLSGRTGLYGVAVRDLDTGQTVLINADREFLSASTNKVLVMYRVYEQLESGLVSANERLAITRADAVEGDPTYGLRVGQVVTVADALEAMITRSSNIAAYRLTRLVGGWNSVYAAAREIGMSSTRRAAGYARTTPRDMLTFFQALAAGRLVSPDASRRMIRLLKRQQVNDRIPALLPNEAVAAHKTGELPGVRNDVGIVYGPHGSYVVVVFSRWANVYEATTVGARVARIAYDRYAR